MDPFSKKDWYDIKAPSAFTVRNVGKTLVTRTAGTKVGQRVMCCGSHALTGHGMTSRPSVICKGFVTQLLISVCTWCPQIASDGLKGRVFECNLADLQNVSRWLRSTLLLLPTACFASQMNRLHI